MTKEQIKFLFWFLEKHNISLNVYLQSVSLTIKEYINRNDGNSKVGIIMFKNRIKNQLYTWQYLTTYEKSRALCHIILWSSAKQIYDWGEICKNLDYTLCEEKL